MNTTDGLKMSYAQETCRSPPVASVEEDPAMSNKKNESEDAVGAVTIPVLIPVWMTAGYVHHPRDNNDELLSNLSKYDDDMGDTQDTRRTLRKRKRLTHACDACRRAHKACSDGSPCEPCIRQGIADACVRTKIQTRGRKRRHILKSASSSSATCELAPECPDSSRKELYVSNSEHMVLLHYPTFDDDDSGGDSETCDASSLVEGDVYSFPLQPKKLIVRMSNSSNNDAYSNGDSVVTSEPPTTASTSPMIERATPLSLATISAARPATPSLFPDSFAVAGVEMVALAPSWPDEFPYRLEDNAFSEPLMNWQPLADYFQRRCHPVDAQILWNEYTSSMISGFDIQ